MLKKSLLPSASIRMNIVLLLFMLHAHKIEHETKKDKNKRIGTHIHGEISIGQSINTTTAILAAIWHVNVSSISHQTLSSYDHIV